MSCLVRKYKPVAEVFSRHAPEEPRADDDLSSMAALVVLGVEGDGRENILSYGWGLAQSRRDRKILSRSQRPMPGTLS